MLILRWCQKFAKYDGSTCELVLFSAHVEGVDAKELTQEFILTILTPGFMLFLLPSTVGECWKKRCHGN